MISLVNSVLLILMISACTQVYLTSTPSKRRDKQISDTGEGVFGGEEVIPGSIPHQLLIQYRIKDSPYWEVQCGAILLDPLHVLTAAHCLDSPPGILRILAGVHDLNRLASVQIRHIRTVIKHPGYFTFLWILRNDVAIISLDRPFFLESNIRPIELYTNDYDTLERRSCTVSGWGITSITGKSNVLMKVQMSIINNGDCQKLLGTYGNSIVYNSTVCVYEPPKIACRGNSGGPLTCLINNRQVLVGVTSQGMADSTGCLSRYPMVYSRISFFRRWIKSIIRRRV